MFEPPFWIALFEQHENGCYSAARLVIGASEPTGAELASFLSKVDYSRLKFTTPGSEGFAVLKEYRFKKQQQKIKKAVAPEQGKHTYTKAHAMLKKQQEEQKTVRKKQSRIERDAREEEQFRIKQLRRKEKHRGH